jgi:uncharacterized protein (DUF427 family)
MNNAQRPTLQPGQESVWDYPRPPRVELTSKRVEVVFNGIVIASTVRAIRVLETSHPPAYYLPPDDVQMQYFIPTERHTQCEYKGQASYYTIQVGEKRAVNGAWYYPTPSSGYEAIAGYISLYPGRMDICTIDGETVQPQEGDFYGGWITSNIVGPFKGGAGTWGW